MISPKHMIPFKTTYNSPSTLSKAAIKAGTVIKISKTGCSIMINSNSLCFSSKISMGRNLTVSFPQVPVRTPSFFIDFTRAPASLVSKAM